MTDAVTFELAAYALGSLSPAERRTVDLHLAGCAECRAELADLASLPPLLASVDLDDLTTVDPDPGLYARITAAARIDRRRPRRHLRLVAVAASLLLLGAVGTAVGVLAHDSGHSSTATAGRIHISVVATAEDTGTALKVTVAGLPEDEHCHLVAIAADGTRHAAGDWVATYAGHAQVVGSTDVPRADLRQLVLYGTADQQLVTVGIS